MTLSFPGRVCDSGQSWLASESVSLFVKWGGITMGVKAKKILTNIWHTDFEECQTHSIPLLKK